MLQRFELQGVHTAIDDKLRNYIHRKIGRLDRYLPRQARASAHCEVLLKESRPKDNNHCTCEVLLHVPHQNIVIKESAPNMYAAVDIVEAKLKVKLKQYKDTHGSRLRRHLTARWLRTQA